MAGEGGISARRVGDGRSGEGVRKFCREEGCGEFGREMGRLTLIRQELPELGEWIRQDFLGGIDKSSGRGRSGDGEVTEG